MKRRRLAAVIVNFRTPELSLRAVDSLLPEIDPRCDEIILVENGSGDDSLDRLRDGLRGRRLTSPVRIVEAERNRGYSAGVNLGICAVEASHYLVLNSDVVVRGGAVAALVARAEASTRRPALFAPRLEGPTGDVQLSSFPYPSPLGELVEAAGTGLITRLLARYAPAISPSGPEEPRWVSFAAVLVSRDSVEAVGLMDEGFFMFFEDVDYCWRVLESGGSIVDCPEARIVHLRGASSPVKRLREQRKRLPTYFYDSRSRYFIKHLGRTSLWLANAFWMVGQGIAAVREIAGRPRHNPRRAAQDIWRGSMNSVTSSGT